MLRSGRLRALDAARTPNIIRYIPPSPPKIGSYLFHSWRGTSPRPRCTPPCAVEKDPRPLPP
eukprot:scaffold216696_cov30-Tisochrysis_lutea.AAC.1